MGGGKNGVGHGAVPTYLGGPKATGPFFLTCEHASNHIPDEIPVSDQDRPWLDTHWAWDQDEKRWEQKVASTEEELTSYIQKSSRPSQKNQE